MTTVRKFNSSNINSRKTRNYWDNKENQIKFLEDLGRKIGITKLDDWIDVDQRLIANSGGSSILKKNNGWLNTLKSLYPNNEWNVYKKKQPNHYWKNEVNQRNFIFHLCKEYECNDNVAALLEKIPRTEIVKKLKPLLRYNTSLDATFKKLFPEIEWQLNKSSLEVQRQIVKNICERNFIQLPWEWEKLQKKHFVEAEELKIFNKYQSSKKIFESLFLEESQEKARKYIYEFKKSNNIIKNSDWNFVSEEKFAETLEGEFILRKFRNFEELLIFYFPERSWDPSCYNRASNAYFLDEIKSGLNVNKIGDWQNVKFSEIKKYSQKWQKYQFIKKFDNLFSLLNSVYNWKNRFYYLVQIPRILPEFFWDLQEFQRSYLQFIFTELGFSDPSGWTKLKKSQINSFHGKKLILKYSSILHALESIFPEYIWSPHIFSKVPNHFWEPLDNQRKFLKFIENKFNLKTSRDWGTLPLQNVIEFGGDFIIRKYDSLFDCLSTLFPSTSWNIFDFRTSPNFWENPENVFKFLEHVKNELKITHQNDWYRISRSQIVKLGGATLLNTHGGLGPLLQSFYPELDWNLSKFKNRDKRSVQRQLLIQVAQLLGDSVEIIEDFQHQELTRISGANVSFDLYIPQYQLAIEYHGEHHFNEIPSFGSLELYQARDNEKKKLCEEHNIQLVTVPYWWDKSSDSLSKFINIEEIIQQKRK